MIYSPTKAIDSGWVIGDIAANDVQPNGIDFRIQKLAQPVSIHSNEFVLLEDNTLHREYFDVTTNRREFGENVVDGWTIDSNSSYDFTTNLKVSLPHNVAALIIQRSTLNRNSLMITSGLWDSGFEGTVGGQLRNNSSHKSWIQKNVRIGQIVFVEAAAARMYNGQYQNKG